MTGVQSKRKKGNQNPMSFLQKYLYSQCLDLKYMGLNIKIYQFFFVHTFGGAERREVETFREGFNHYYF